MKILTTPETSLDLEERDRFYFFRAACFENKKKDHLSRDAPRTQPVQSHRDAHTLVMCASIAFKDQTSEIIWSHRNDDWPWYFRKRKANDNLRITY